MNRVTLFAPVVFVALAIAAGPASAAQRGAGTRGEQDRDRGSARGSNNRGSDNRGPGRAAAPPPSPPGTSGTRRFPGNPTIGVAVPRATPRVIERPSPAARREPERRATAPRRDVDRREIDRRPGPARVIVPRPIAPRVFAPRYVAPRVIAPRIVRPAYPRYYSFRPRFRMAFGIFIGYPVAFPARYYPYASVVAVPVRVPVAAGGLSFDIWPDDAAIYVDGRYMGEAEDFSPTMQPLALAPGRHRVDLYLTGYEPMAFDVDVLAGQVIPFEGVLELQ
jgi:hypothetical protein